MVRRILSASACCTALAALLLLWPLPDARAQTADDATAETPASDPAADAEAVTDDAVAAEDDGTGVVDDEEALLTTEEIEPLVAPVALYPDALLAQIFVASTYPLEIMKADQWVADNAELEPEARSEAADQEGWDPSVAVLAAGFPTVIERMADDIDTTEALGNALILQSQDVFDTVQLLRAQADALGNLESNEAQTVEVEDDTITIEPADPEVVYVPTYDTQTVYTQPVVTTEQPVVVTQPSDDGWSTGGVLATAGVAFLGGMIVNEIFDDNDHWNDYYRPGYPPVGWRGGGVRPYPGRGRIRAGNTVNIDNVNINRNRNARIDGNGRWNPDDRRKREAKRKQANRKVANNRNRSGNRPNASNRPRPNNAGGRDQLKRQLSVSDRGSAKANLSRVRKDGNKTLRAPKNRAKPAKRPANRKSALSKNHGKTLNKTHAAKNRGTASKQRIKKPGAAKPRAAQKKLSRPKAVKKPARKAAKKRPALRKGNGKRAGAHKARGGRSKKRGGGRRRRG